MGEHLRIQSVSVPADDILFGVRVTGHTWERYNDVSANVWPDFQWKVGIATVALLPMASAAGHNAVVVFPPGSANIGIG